MARPGKTLARIYAGSGTAIGRGSLWISPCVQIETCGAQQPRSALVGQSPRPGVRNPAFHCRWHFHFVFGQIGIESARRPKGHRATATLHRLAKSDGRRTLQKPAGPAAESPRSPWNCKVNPISKNPTAHRGLVQSREAGSPARAFCPAQCQFCSACPISGPRTWPSLRRAGSTPSFRWIFFWHPSATAGFMAKPSPSFGPISDPTFTPLFTALSSNTPMITSWVKHSVKDSGRP